jgi:hypothetical protein
LIRTRKLWIRGRGRSLPRSARVEQCTSSGFLLSILLLFALVLSKQARGQSLPSTNSKKNSIHGVVINGITREPISHALVFSPDNRFATMTDDQGRFELAFPQAVAGKNLRSNDTWSIDGATYDFGSYSIFSNTLKARKPGFLKSENSTRPENDSSAAPGMDVTITLVPEALIVGHIVLPSANAYDRIGVELYKRQVSEGRPHWNRAGFTNTRSNGEFRFADLEPGTYKLFTRELLDRDPLTFDPRGPMYGYPPAYFPKAIDFQTASLIQLTPGTTFQAELSPLRQPYYPVKVPISNGPDEQEVVISVAVQGRKGPGFELAYNGREQRIEGSLPDGTYLIEATSFGPQGATGSTTITVKGAALEGSPMTLMPHSSVRFNVKLEFHSKDSEENRNQSVVRQSQGLRQTVNPRLEPLDEFGIRNAPQLHQPTSPDDDSLVFEDVAPGRYRVRIDSSEGFTAALTSGDIDLLRLPLTVGTGSSLVIDATMHDDGAELSGSVEGIGTEPTTAGNATAEGGRSYTMSQLPAFVYCIPLPESSGEFREGFAMWDGQFHLQQVPPGAYRVLAFDRQQPDLEYRSVEAMRTYDTKGQIVRLVTGQKENISLQLISTKE